MKNNTSIVITFILTTIFFGLVSCTENPTEQKEEPCPPINVVSIAPYNTPIWHPNGKFIGFNYTPLDSIIYSYGEHCFGNQYFNYDSTGFWLVNTDGKNKRRIFPYQLYLATWSPDGKWIAFVMDSQIYKMPFNINEEKFDSTQMVQLTFKDRNFYPSWSPDGKWVTYDSNSDSPVGGYRIWRMKTNGDSKFLVVDGRMPFWSNDLKWVFYIGMHSEIFKVNIYDTTKVIQITHLNESNIYATDNRYPRLSPYLPSIAFISSNNTGEPSQLWTMELSNNSYKKLTNSGVGDIFSWAPSGDKIVYTNYNSRKWNYENGVLWIIDTNTGSEYQLTFNFPKKVRR